MKNQVICGDCKEILCRFPPNTFDTIITDPPYGLGFMGKEWDKPGMEHRTAIQINSILPAGGEAAHKWEPLAFQQWSTEWAKICLRVAKPGAMMLVFGGTRTYHRLACAIEDAGWEIRDCMMWLYGSGFPKSLDISKAIDKAAGAKREKGKLRTDGRGKWELKCQREKGDTGIGHADGSHQTYNETAPATDLAKQWNGWGTALKPAWEPIIVAMKPLDGTFAHNAEKHSVAGLWIDGGRIGTEIQKPSTMPDLRDVGTKSKEAIGIDKLSFGQVTNAKRKEYVPTAIGRWPANLLLDEESAEMLDVQSGKRAGCKPHHIKASAETKQTNKEKGWGSITAPNKFAGFVDSGGASRFFYTPKASKKERNIGCEDLPEKIKVWNGQSPESSKDIKDVEQRWTTKAQNTHPTVKPLALMEYLCKLTKTPTGGLVLDPFGGSGTTALACINTGRDYILIEKEPEYCEIANKRIGGLNGGVNAVASSN